MSKHWIPHKSVLCDDGSKPEDFDHHTRAVSSRTNHRGVHTEPLTVPIYHSSTYKIKSVDQYLEILNEPYGGGIYSRLQNGTTDALEAAVHAVEGGAGSLSFASGMAAITCTLLSFLSSGDHMVVNNPCYSGLYKEVVDMLPRYGIEITFVQAGCPIEDYKNAVKPNTKVLYGETPCNPDMTLLDLEEFGRLGSSLDGVVTIVDSTFGGPFVQSPVECGVDISINSCTKYIGGHSDLIAGVATTRTLEQWQKLKLHQSTFGMMLSPHDASLVLRGLKTLPLRMQRHSSNAQKIAEFLENHKKIAKVMYPGLVSHPQYDIAKKQMNGYSGMMSFEVVGGVEAGKILVENVKLIQLAVSLGGVESLIEHPATMTHGPMLMTDEDRKSGRITDGLIRLSVGLEDPDDLIKDLERALDKVKIE